MIQAAIRNAEMIIHDVERKRRVRIIAGMIDAVPGTTCFRIYLGKGVVFDFEASTSALAVQPRLIELKLFEEIDERRKL